MFSNFNFLCVFMYMACMHVSVSACVHTDEYMRCLFLLLSVLSFETKSHSQNLALSISARLIGLGIYLSLPSCIRVTDMGDYFLLLTQEPWTRTWVLRLMRHLTDLKLSLNPICYVLKIHLFNLVTFNNLHML